MIFIVCGGRSFKQEGKIFTALDGLHAQYTCTLLITGGASGADSGADRWAQTRGIDRVIVPANWERDGRPGGPIRNARMLQLARLLATAKKAYYVLIAFPGEDGTGDMCSKARGAGIHIIYPMGEDARSNATTMDLMTRQAK